MKKLYSLAVLPLLFFIPKCGQPPICTSYGKVVRDHAFYSGPGFVPYGLIYTSDVGCSLWTVVNADTYWHYPIGSTYYGPVGAGGSW